ncbi:hypothetical protein [Clostridium felsineum]|uniref:hypothetical protein n=1 Tax=Clostridium felsineum TaxID=36839 RepID=UPI0009D18B62|nr:hypothetical protein [Clostridium felsineum]URZ14629.1 hypothetical protein CLFE_006260 [Clostridium felsineum DSM 794]
MSSINNVTGLNLSPLNSYMKDASLANYLSDDDDKKKGGISDYFSGGTDDVQSLIENDAKSFNNSDFSKSINSLVTDGTLTETQATSVKSAFQSAVQCAAYGNYNSNAANPFSALISSGTITKDQMVAIQSAFKSKYNG